MKRLLPLVPLSFLLLASSAAGDGCPPETCGVQSTALPGSPVVMTQGQQGFVAYDVRTGARRFALPFAFLSADGSAAFAPSNTRKATVVERYDAHSGRLDGAWTFGPKLWFAVVSADGRRLVLADARSNRWRTALVVVDTATNARQTVVLHGRFQAEALSLDGRRLFLIQYVRRGYRVRMYDVARGALRPGELRPRNEEEAMRGYPAYAIAAPHGRWLLTLYIKPKAHEAFVHALDLRRAVAYCIDLPGHAVAGKMGRYALALGVDGRTLVAANPALGLATEIDLGTLEVSRALQFAESFDRGAWINAAMSPRGDLVYFGGLKHLWAFDLRARHIRGPYTPGLVGGFAFTPDGRKLTVISPRGRAEWLDAATGRKL
jgi:hypothetical protein